MNGRSLTSWNLLLFVILSFCCLSNQLTQAQLKRIDVASLSTDNPPQSPKIKITVDRKLSSQEQSSLHGEWDKAGALWAGANVSSDDSDDMVQVKSIESLSRGPLRYVIIRRRPPLRNFHGGNAQRRRIPHSTSHGNLHQPRIRVSRNPVNRPITLNSGLKIRLRGNHSVNKGIVEVKVGSYWGFICKDDHWEEEDARVVCQQLGFSRGVNASVTYGVSVRRLDSHLPFAMSRVACHGSEDQIQNCVFNSSAHCPLQRAVQVHCSVKAGCSDSWLAGSGFCYKLIQTAATFEDAEATCRSLDSYLVKIESQKENDFISNMLMAERAIEAVWTSGRRTEHSTVDKWKWSSSSLTIRFTKWFPGYNETRLQSQPNVARNHSCVALSRAFQDERKVKRDVDYFFWMSLPCILNLPFVCKKVMQSDDCYEGNGSGYRGIVFVTARASLCQKWTESRKISPETYHNAGLGDHNYCRNPDGDERPWCWVDAEQSQFGYCAVSSCTRTEVSLPTQSSTDIPVIKVRLRDGQSDHGGRVEVWYEGQWGNICDNQWDIPDADVVCRQLGFVGALRKSTRREFHSGDGISILLDNVQCSGLENSIFECRHSPWGEHSCRSYETAGVICKPNKVCMEEKEIQCPGNQGHICVPLSYVCDKQWDCSDGSDEASCTHFDIALVDGSRPSEGRVQITINNITGTVCDDDWDDRDAAVVCRMLGYSTGIAQAVTGAQFGQGRGPIWLDNVDCSGDEDDLESCSHPVWGEHNCMHNEDAGVSCITSARTMPPKIVHSPVVQDCGRRPIQQPQARIVGGQYAVYGAYPWQARILKKNLFGEFVHSCGGTVIGQSWVLSAAHCFENTQRESVRVRIGDHRSSGIEQHEQEFAVSQIFVHPRYMNLLFILYGHARYDYDIALVKLLSPGIHGGIRFSNFVQPACLPTASAEYTPKLICEVSGWGLNERNSPSILMSAMIPIRQQAECQILYKYKLSRKMFCAGDGRADTCQGDSGGPLVCQVNGTYTIMGITSWGFGCGIRDSPGIYTKVGEFTDWIQQTIRNNK